MTGRAHRELTFESLNKLPHPVWIASLESELIWANEAYKMLGSPQSPEAPVFEFDTIKAMQNSGDRVSLMHPRKNGQTHWFDVSMFELEYDSYFNYAINVDGLIAAEVAQRKFVQTLAKTFAQLSIGLAIFDRDRRLVLFNPALVDLTALPAHFLSAQPNLQSFFDQLRENRIMPEPKDYASWRSQIADLVVKSVGGNYQETWSLPSGLTYRVSGRPHPDGAIALLIEDITAEITLTRRFKGQIELSNTALETLKSAVVIFGPDGSVVFWNSTFKTLFNISDSASTAEHTVPQFLQSCRQKFEACEGLEALQSALRKLHGSSSTDGSLKLRNGEALTFQLRTHDGTSAIVTFNTVSSAARKTQPKLAPAG
ncbi:PAS-domain containing protein [Lentibacter algarum]|nr:PAS-domain containing protein [Lentibacter algarum]